MKSNRLCIFVIVFIFSSFIVLYANQLEGFVHLGREGETCYVNEKSTIAYGANGIYIYKANVKGKITISNQFFNNDPVPNVRKDAYYKPNNGSVNIEVIKKQTDLINQKYPGYTYLGKSGDMVIVPENSFLAFGKNSNYRLHDNVAGEFRLSNSLLWHHDSDETFYCFYKKMDSDSLLFSHNDNNNYPEGPGGYTYLGSEGQMVFLPRECDLVYGAKGEYSYKTGMKGYIQINNTLFGDPIPGVYKHCYYKIVPEKSVPDFEHDPLYTRDNVNRELDHALKTGKFEAFYDISTAWINKKYKQAGLAGGINRLLTDGEFARILALRQFIHQTGVENINAFAGSREHKSFLQWIVADQNILDLYLQGGKPLVIDPVKDHPGKSLSIWYDIYTQDPQSVRGIYLKLAIATALAFNSPLKSYYNSMEHLKQVDYIDPVKRYFHYKHAHQKGELFEQFNTLTVWEYRSVVTAWATDEDITWAREMIRTMRPDLLHESRVHDAAGLMQYSGDLSPVTNYRDLLEIGGMCGAISFLGALGNHAFGLPALGLGQPRHAAFGFRFKENTWWIGNDIATWRFSYAQNMQGVETLNRGNNPFSYFLLLAEARSNPDMFKRTEQYRWFAEAVYFLNDRQKVRMAGLKLNPKNYMLWNEKIADYRSMDDIVPAVWNRLFTDYTNAFQNFPDQLADFFTSINRPGIIGRMDASLFTAYGENIYAAMEAGISSRYNHKFNAMMDVIQNKIDFDFDYLIPEQLSATDTAHQNGEPGSNLVDGKIGEGAIWHTDHDLSRALPQSVTISFDDTYRIDKITYWPRQDSGSNGNILAYDLYGTEDGYNFFKLASGTWDNNNQPKTVTFNARNLTDIRLTAREGSGGWASGEEIRIYKQNANHRSLNNIVFTENNHFDTKIEQKTGVLTGTADLLFPDPRESMVLNADKIIRSERVSILTGYNGDKQMNITQGGKMVFNLDSPLSGNYALRIVYATPYKNGVLKILGKEYRLSNSNGLWRKSKPIKIPLHSGDNSLTIACENLPLIAVQRIIISNK